MKINFTKIVLHNFLSFGHAELDLSNAGYCLVQGVNNNTADSASSNGAGKSSIWSGISYALTGETIQGISSNIVNIYSNDGCYVELYFSADNNNYKIVRSKDYKSTGSDLQIFINDENKSGKTFTESKKLLEQYLSELTGELLGSVIILGQGMPHKFSNNTPSGRKQELESLSKSDFMIEDIKDRLSNRLSDLNNQLNTANQKDFEYNTQHKLSEKHIDNINDVISKITNNSYNEEIANLEKKIVNAEFRKKELEEQLSTQSLRLESIEQQRQAELDTMNSILSSMSSDYNDVMISLNQDIAKLEIEIEDLTSKLTDLNNKKDVCPLCGQKLTKKHIHENEELKESYSEKQNQSSERLKYLKDKKIDITNNYNSDVSNVKSDFSQKTQSLNEEINNLKTSVNKNKKDLENLTTSELSELKINLKVKINEKENYQNRLKELQDELIKEQNNIANLDNNILYNNNEIVEINSHLAVLNKMNTLIKRDFRGYLLTNVIDFISRKVKEYCPYLFNNDRLDFKMNGNNLDITYCDKTYENLSGGEKQKVDLIMQFAIRDFLSTYLNFSCNIIVLDEIFDNLDAVGCNNVINLLSTKLSDIESVFIISHHADSLQICQDKVITVEKNDKGISSIL